MIKCKICNEDFPTPKQLSWHVKHHNMNNQQYYDIYMKKPNEGYCLVCGKPTQFVSLNLGYRRHCNKTCVTEDKQVQVKRLNTNLDKYGYKTSFSVSETQDKVKQKFIDKYGVSNPFASEEIKEKIKQVNLQKYGVENPQQNETIKQKTGETNLKKYGNICSMQNTEIKQAIKQSMIEKYGAENFFASEQGKQKIKETNLMRYGVENPQQNHKIHVKTMKHYKYDSVNFDSSWELAVYIYCTDNKINITREPTRFKYTNKCGKLCYYFPDFMVDGCLVEIKGDQYLDTDGTLLDKEKQQCMIEHNVQLWVRQDVQKYIRYCEEKFDNDVHWYNQFR